MESYFAAESGAKEKEFLRDCNHGSGGHGLAEVVEEHLHAVDHEVRKSML